MTTMNISLPNAMKAFVDDQTASGSYSSTSEYIRSLLRGAQKRAAQERLETQLLEGLNSGKATPMTRKDWESIRREGLRRLSRRRPK